MVTFGVASHLVGECCCILMSVLFKVAILTATGTTSSLDVQDNTTGVTILVPLPPVGDHPLVVRIAGVLVAVAIVITTASATTSQKILGEVVNDGLKG